MIEKLLRSYLIISDQMDPAELRSLLVRLELVLKQRQTGAIVEFGCYIGTTSLFIRRLCDAYDFRGSFHVYDSFAGLPEKTVADQSVVGDQFTSGALAVSKRDFIRQFAKAHLALPIIHRGWFADLTASDVPSEIVFAFLDGDYYESIRDSLRLITPQLVPGAYVIVDDYTSSALPGVARAVDEWLRIHPAKLQVKSSLAIIHL